MEVLPLYVKGKSVKEIAEMLFISEDTVESHIKNIRSKTGATSGCEVGVKVVANVGNGEGFLHVLNADLPGLKNLEGLAHDPAGGKRRFPLRRGGWPGDRLEHVRNHVHRTVYGQPAGKPRRLQKK